MGVTIDELTVADLPGGLVGARVRGRRRHLRASARCGSAWPGPDAGKGLVGWSLRNVESDELDGLPTTRSDRPPPNERPAHPNGITALDHVVAITPALDRTVAALRGAGLDLRRIREEPTPAGAPRQAFFRLGATILEVVQEPRRGDRARRRRPPAFFWGLAFLAPDLDATVAALGDRVGEARPAVQPGRRIATLRRSAGLSVPVALLTPRSA